MKKFNFIIYLASSSTYFSSNISNWIIAINEKNYSSSIKKCFKNHSVRLTMVYVQF